ncbi:MAG: asparagine synthase-related protein [Pseudomonadota bacterium]
MPGLCFLQSFTGCLDIDRAKRAVLALGLPGWNSRTYLEAAGCLALGRDYDGYPILVWENEKYHFYLEGYLYGLSRQQATQTVEGLAGTVFSSPLIAGRLSAWIQETDGDFFIWMREKETGRSAFINDALARLPVYYFQGPAEVMLSRNMRFLTQMGVSALDRMGVAQHLALGHGLDGRTLWSGITRFPIASLLLIDPRDKRLSLTPLNRRNFSSRRNSRNTAAENASQLAELFCQACDRRAGLGEADIVSLSGGLDSRSTAAGLAAAGRPFTAMTFSLPGYQQPLEVQTAKTVAAILGRPWRLVPLQAPTWADAGELLHIKSGLNSLGMAFILGFYKAIREAFGGRITHFTGDGGDYLLHAVIPLRPLNSEEHLVQAIFNANYIVWDRFWPEDAAALAGVAGEDLYDALARSAAGFPEQTWRDKFLHHWMFSQITTVINEAQDRERHYFWTASPFFSPPFVDFALNCPDVQKSGYELYRRFIKVLSAQAAAVPYAPYGDGLDSIKLKFIERLNRIKKGWPRQFKVFKSMVKGNEDLSPRLKIIKAMDLFMAKCPEAGAYVDQTRLTRVLLSPRYNHRHALNLLSVVATAAECLCGRSSLPDWPKEDM